MIHTNAGYIVYGTIALITFLYLSYCFRELARKKAVDHDWLAWVPFVRYYMLSRVIGKGVVWTLLLAIPILNLFILIATFLKLARVCGHRRVFGLLLLIPFVNFIAWWVLAFGHRHAGPGSGQDSISAR